MKHCILAKFTPEAKAQRAALLPRIREIFSAAADIPGVHGAEVIPNCVDRDNRYDVLIRLDMDREALPLYDVSAMHHRWKDEFTPLLEKKAIFWYAAWFLCCSPRWPIPFFTARGSSISSVLLWTKALKNYSIFGRPLWIMYCF